MDKPVVRQRHVAGHQPMLSVWLATVLLVGACYAGGPFFTLWRISRALDRGDVAALQSLVDWTAVRQGLKDDIAGGVLGMSQRTLVASNTLPPFGSGFVIAIAGTEVDRTVTPQGLLLAARQFDPPSAPGSGLSFPAIVGAGFSTPRHFDLHLRAACQDAEEEPMHVRLAFQGGGWQVVRVWIPQDLMDCASSRT